MRIMGLPMLAEGDRVLLFLRAEEQGAHGIVEYALGMFWELDVGGESLLVREPSLEGEAPRPGGPPAAERAASRPPRNAGRFRQWIAGRAAGVERPVDYFESEVVDLPATVASPYRLLRCLDRPIRWRNFDLGESVGFVVHSGGQPGVPGGGLPQVRAGMSVWNNDDGSRVNLAVLRTTNERLRTRRWNSAPSIMYEDPYDDIKGSFEESNILATTWVFFRGGCRQHQIPGTQRTGTEILDASIVTQDGLGDLLRSGQVANPTNYFEQIIAHELGHAIGIGHPCEPDESGCDDSHEHWGALMWPSVGRADPSRARLHRDDQAAVRYVYPILESPGSDTDPDGSDPDAGTCSGVTCLLQGERFRVKAWYSKDGNLSQGAGAIAATLEDSAGLFTAGSDGPEFLVRIVNRCRTTGYWEVYAGVASDADFSVAVRHVETNELKWFRGPGGQSVADTEAFSCTNNDDRASPGGAGGDSDSAACSGATCLLQDDRFRVKSWYRGDGGSSQRAEAIAADLGESAGLFTFASGGPELLVRTVNRCSTRGYWEVYAGAASETTFSVAVRDTETNELKWFWAGSGQSVADTEAFSCPGHAPIPDAAIPDAALRSAIRYSLGLPSGAPLTPAALGSLHTLDADDTGIRDLTGLEFATNLTYLRLERNRIADISPLEGLVELKSLYLGYNEIADISPLEGLAELKHLKLDHNEIVDISPLEGLAELQFLTLRQNEIVDISPLEGLAELKHLKLDHNEIADIRPLEGFTNIWALSLDGNKIADISPLTRVTSLQVVFLSDNEIVDISPLEGLAKLRWVLLNGNKIVDISPLERLAKLELLDLAHNEIADISSLEGLAKLRWVVLNGNKIADISPLEGLAKLELLELAHNEIVDISPLEGLAELKNLRLEHNEIADISPLEGSTLVDQLDLSGNRIADISPLRGLNRLEWLDLSYNEIADVSPLEGLSNDLWVLGLSDNKIGDVSPLASLTHLGHLSLSANEIADVRSLGKLTELQGVYLGFNAITDVAPLARLPSLNTWLKWLDLRGNPLDRPSVHDHITFFGERGVHVEYDSFRKGSFDIELVFLGPFTAGQKSRVEWASRRWMSVISDDLPAYEFTQDHSAACGGRSFDIDAGEVIDDLRIYVTSHNGLQSFGGPTVVRDNGLPVLGCMEIVVPLRPWLLRDPSHQIGHVLGVGTLWGDLLRDPNGDTHFSGPLAIAAFDNAGGRASTGAKVPVEADGRHWRYPVLKGELMVHKGELMLHEGVYSGLDWRSEGGAEVGALSRITVQALADLGYGVDVTGADEYTVFGAAASTGKRRGGGGSSGDAWERPPEGGQRSAESLWDFRLGSKGAVALRSDPDAQEVTLKSRRERP